MIEERDAEALRDFDRRRAVVADRVISEVGVSNGRSRWARVLHAEPRGHPLRTVAEAFSLIVGFDPASAAARLRRTRVDLARIP